MDVGDVDWYTALHQHFVEQGMSEQEATDLFNKIAADSKIAKGHTVHGELLHNAQRWDDLYAEVTQGGCLEEPGSLVGRHERDEQVLHRGC